MNKKIWNIFDSSFAHDKTSVAGVDSQYVEWNRNFFDFNNPTFYANFNLFDIQQNLTPFENSYALLFESRAIIPEFYQLAPKVIAQFKLFFTPNSDLLRYDNARWMPAGGIWIGGTFGQGEIKIADKTKLCSLLSSNRLLCPLHQFRMDICQAFLHHPKIDIFGTFNGPWVPVYQTLEAYMFSIVVENDIDDLYFTEKIQNCFATGTVPIYKGAHQIGEKYNTEGIIPFETLDDLKKIVAKLDANEYHHRQRAITENFERCQQYRSIEDYLYLTYFQT